MQRRFERDRSLLQEENKKLQTETEKVSNVEWHLKTAWNFLHQNIFDDAFQHFTITFYFKFGIKKRKYCAGVSY